MKVSKSLWVSVIASISFMLPMLVGSEKSEATSVSAPPLSENEVAFAKVIKQVMKEAGMMTPNPVDEEFWKFAISRLANDTCVDIGKDEEIKNWAKQSNQSPTVRQQIEWYRQSELGRINKRAAGFWNLGRANALMFTVLVDAIQETNYCDPFVKPIVKEKPTQETGNKPKVPKAN